MRRISVSFGLIVTFVLTCHTSFAAKPAGKEYVYKQVGDRELKLYVTSPESKSEEPRPAIVFFHGGGWVGGAPGQFTEHSKYFASRGLVCVQVEYRLLDRKSDDPPITCVQDAKSAMRWVRSHAPEFHIDPQRIAAGGGSAGGHLAAFVGLVDGLDAEEDDQSISAKANALLLFNPVFDNGPEGWGHQRVKSRYREFSPLHNISADDPPAIVFLGDEDKLVPVETAYKFRKQMTAAGLKCEVHIYEGMPHGFFNYGKYGGVPYYETVLASDRFLQSLGWLEGEATIRPPKTASE